MSIQLIDVSTFFFNSKTLNGVSLEIAENKVTSVIGPSKSGKTTFLRLFNRLNETKNGFRTNGTILMDGVDIFQQDVQELRRTVGMVFSKPQSLPGTVLNNLAFGLMIQGAKNEEIVFKKIQEVLKKFYIWEYFEERLHIKASLLSPLQKQLLSLARVLVLNPDVLLFEQPTKYLSELEASELEAIIFDLKKNHTIILDATSMLQARRLSDCTIFLNNGRLIEYGDTKQIFTQPNQTLTENFIRGRYHS